MVKQIDPKRRAALVAFEFTPGASLIERFQALFAAAAHGEITPEEAQALSRVLEREGNSIVKAAGVARDPEHDTRADQQRAAAPVDPAPTELPLSRTAAEGEPTLLKPCSIWLPTDAAAPEPDPAALRNPARWRNAATVERMLRNAGAAGRP
ncbi:MAG: hypothetical protein HY060_06820 [Proteobacteria bacterium]|nr:hypothetical protein [Pseudomonadota bacterium]